MGLDCLTIRHRELCEQALKMRAAKGLFPSQKELASALHGNARTIAVQFAEMAERIQRTHADYVDVQRRRLPQVVEWYAKQKGIWVEPRTIDDLTRGIREVTELIHARSDESDESRWLRSAEIPTDGRAFCDELLGRFITMDVLGRPGAEIEDYYQNLPLLREIKREQLPRDRQEAPLDGKAERGMRPLDILRWEEELRQERITYEAPVTIDDMFGRLVAAKTKGTSSAPRGIILGPPGSGKTTFTKYAAWRAAKGELHLGERPLIPALLSLRDWESWATKPVAPEPSLPDYLAHRYKDFSVPPSATQWRQWLKSADVLLLLDGLDEIEAKQPFLVALKNALGAFSDCPTFITCRTVSLEQHRDICPDFPLFTLAPLDAYQRNAFINTFFAERQGGVEPGTLIEQLDQAPEMNALAANPLLLSIICYVLDEPHGIPLPATRSQLYEKAVDKLLARRPRRVDVTYPGGKQDLPHTRKRRILERAALALFAAIGWEKRLTFSDDSLLDVLSDAAMHEGLANPADVADVLRDDLVKNSGILRGDGEDGYFFLHLTIHEFLASAALARVINQEGWGATVELFSRRARVADLVGRKVWHPRWQNLVALLAGQLSEPEHLLRMLADENSDDFMRHRLAAASLCLAELGPSARGSLAAQVDEITTEAFSFWYRHLLQGTEIAIPQFARVLPALAQAGGKVRISSLPFSPQSTIGSATEETEKQLPILVLLSLLLQHRRSALREASLATIRNLGSVTASRYFLGQLVSLLHGPDPALKDMAIKAIRRMGAAAATPFLLRLLPRLLQHHDPTTRLAATETARALGSFAGSSKIIAQIPFLLGDKQPSVRVRAGLLIGSLGKTGGTSHLRARALGHQDPTVRLIASLTIGERASAEILAQGLGDTNPYVLVETAQALCSLGSAAATPDVLAPLIQRLGDPATKTRRDAAELVGIIGKSAATGEVIDRVAALLQDDKPNVREAAARALRIIGGTAATRPVLSGLLLALQDNDPRVRQEGQLAVWNMCGEAADDRNVLAQLFGLLPDGVWRGAADDTTFLTRSIHHNDPVVPFVAAITTATIRDELPSRIVIFLSSLLRKGDPGLRSAGAICAARMGTYAAQTEIMAVLPQLLHDSHPGPRGTGAIAIAFTGSATKAPNVLGPLIELLHDRDECVRRMAAEGLLHIAEEGRRIFLNNNQSAVTRSVAELNAIR